MRAVIVFISLLFFSACNDKSNLGVVFQNGNGTSSPSIEVEVAATPSTRRLGLMYRTALPQNYGMLFIFPTEEPRSFWMKNTHLELDIFYISADFKVVSIVQRATPFTETPRPSAGAAKYVIELRGGSAEKWGIGPGSKLTVTGNLPRAQ